LKINPENHSVPLYVATKMKAKKYDTALVLPIINEGQRILIQLEKIRCSNPFVDIVIADGGSTDGTLEFLLNPAYGVTAILVKTGPGKLSAQLRMAFDFCLTEGYQNIITMDGNNKDDPEGIEVIINALESGFDFVQGSRFIAGGKSFNTPLYRYLAIKLIHAPITSIASGFRFTDTTNGFRGHTKKLLESKKLSIFREVFQTYELIAYMPISAKRNGFRVCEVPVTRSYPASGHVPTKIHGILAQLRLLQILLYAALGKYTPSAGFKSDPRIT
jgi:dolichol-phosphate mannosyltransferase